MTTYYIDLSASTNGAGSSRGDPYNSFASLPTLSAGDIVEVEPGSSQTMSGQYSVSGSGTINSRIVIRANPAVSGSKPRLRIASEGSVGLLISGQDYVTVQNLVIEGDSSWTSSNTIGLRNNGTGVGVTLDGVETIYCSIGIDLVGGFAKTDLLVNDCKGTYCRADGLRCFSGTGTYTWDGVTIRGGDYSNNGLAQGSNAMGINFVVQSGHTGSTFKNVSISNVRATNNYGAGINVQDISVAFSTIKAAGNTTPPTRQFKNVNIFSNTVVSNGGCGISLNGASGGSIQRNVVTDNSTLTTLQAPHEEFHQHVRSRLIQWQFWFHVELRWHISRPDDEHVAVEFCIQLLRNRDQRNLCHVIRRLVHRRPIRIRARHEYHCRAFVPVRQVLFHHAHRVQKIRLEAPFPLPPCRVLERPNLHHPGTHQ